MRVKEVFSVGNGSPSNGLTTEMEAAYLCRSPEPNCRHEECQMDRRSAEKTSRIEPKHPYFTKIQCFGLVHASLRAQNLVSGSPLARSLPSSTFRSYIISFRRIATPANLSTTTKRIFCATSHSLRAETRSSSRQRKQKQQPVGPQVG